MQMSKPEHTPQEEAVAELPTVVQLIGRFKRSVSANALVARNRGEAGSQSLRQLAELYRELEDEDRYFRIKNGLESRSRLPQWVLEAGA